MQRPAEPTKPTDNRYQVYKAYLAVMFMTVVFLGCQVLMFYLPSLSRSYNALTYLQEHKQTELGELTFKDALYYGAYLQSQADMSASSTMFALWMLGSYLLLILMGIGAEKYFVKLFEGQSYYQDLTLEFKFLSDTYDDEAKILKLFQILSSGNVREISLIYDLSEYFGLEHKLNQVDEQIKANGQTSFMTLKKEMMEDRMESFKEHFRKYKKAYFLNRGFVTFSTHKMALEMKEIYKKAYLERPQGPLDEFLMRIKKLDRKAESNIRRKFRRIVMQKIIGVRAGSKVSDHLSRAVKLLFGSQDSMFNKKVKLMRDEVGDQFTLTRGVAAEDINWKYVPEKKMQALSFVKFFAIILLVIPGFMFLLSVVYYENTIENLKGSQRGAQGFIVDQGLFVSMLGLDQIALRVIDRMLPSGGFLKEHQAVGLKFLSTNLYFLSSGLLFLFLGLVVAANTKMNDIVETREQFMVTKKVLDSFYMTFIALIVTNVNSHILMPIYNFYIRSKNKQVERDITYPLSFMCLAVYYVGFFAPFDINIILIMFVSVLVLFVAELVLYHLGIVQPTRINFTIIGNYILALTWGLLPITLSAFLMLEGNKMGIRTFSFGFKESFWVSFVVLIYIITVTIYTILFKNERLLRRIQSQIWTVNQGLSAPDVLQGASYRASNPVYTFEGKLKLN